MKVRERHRCLTATGCSERRGAMFLQQAELLRGMDRDFIKSFLDIATKEYHEAGEFLFHKGESAAHFYILIKGHVRLILGHVGHVIHVVDRTGEAFGWSSLVDRSFYSCSAQCVVPSKVLMFEHQKIQMVLENHPVSGMIFFKRLAKVLGERLLQRYDTAGPGESAFFLSFGSGQVAEVNPI